ncbi:MAG: Fis family transcriptional regulator, partial [Burkholderiales bacterium]|nr:Fis family transcriptional regulator [Burkholderiales bacterium]
MSLSPNVFFSTPAQRVGLARQRFFDEGQRPAGLVSDAVIQSWTRCTQAARAVGESISFTPVTRSRIDAAISRNRMLLEAGHQDLLQLQQMLAGTGCKVILTDARGIVVHSSPTQAEDGRLMWLAGRVGVDLSEPCVGTAAPGMVLVSGDSCTVRGAEHYFQVNHGMHCAAAPIRDVRGELAAVLDLSCEGREFQFDAMALASLYASAIENRLLIRQSRPFVLLRFQADPQLLFTPMEGLAAVDEAGQLLWTNDAGRSLLQAPQAPRGAASAEQLFGLKLAELVAAARTGQWLWHGLPNGLRLCLLAQAEASALRPMVALGAVAAEA